MNDAQVALLQGFLDPFRLTFEPAADGSAVLRWESRTYAVRGVPLDDLDEDEIRGELWAIAAGFEAAVKHAGRLVASEDIRIGAQTLLPKVVRRRFIDAYEAVVSQREGDLGDLSLHGLYAHDLGAGLATVYVQDLGWKVNFLPKGRIAVWDVSPGTVHAAGRSNLYHRAALDHHALELRHQDGYDAARVLIADEVFYDRSGPDGIELALPGRDVLLVPRTPLDPATVRAAYERDPQPLSPRVFGLKAGRLQVLRR